MIPLPFNDYLALYSLREDTTKSDILRSIIIPAVKELKRGFPDNKLISDVVEQYQMNWDYIKERKKDINSEFTKYVELVNNNLTYKGIPIHIIEAIVTKIKM